MLPLPKETTAEKMAAEATSIESFPLQLSDIRRTVAEALDQFGRHSIFSQYTVHSYGHVHSMLDDVERFVPLRTRKALTKVDWLMLVLSIYFHDLGLVVTEEEFEKRSLSDFSDFKENVLFAGPEGGDYRSKVLTLGDDKSERFFYQEFVRKNHGKRVAAWIEGSDYNELGYAEAMIKEVGRLFGSVSKDFRRDLARVCESHNLDDLERSDKYKTFKPYGPSPDEVCNLLYIAVVLRSLDLLQITKQRAPSTMFRLINPSDPISQIEWIKQNSVTGVFIKETRDSEGHILKDVQSDTFSVYAKFDNENGFFGLTSYLQYAQAQLQRSYAIIQKAHPDKDEGYTFPWRRIDDSEVEADGFDPKPYQFRIDQTKILDLLTGHTLYNNSSVAIRELVQNSLDAVRLQCARKGTTPLEHGEISISWKASEQELTILDNGTGMTQEIIEKHLLSVGSSRYQDASFKEQNPKFSSISRFGIGVLSAFMVADSIQIITFSEDEHEGRQISLRSVHGKYLIRLLKKESDAGKEVGPHGTKVTIKIRASSRLVDVRGALEQWIVFPRCKVVYKEDDRPLEQIGHGSPAEALTAFLQKEPGYSAQYGDIEIITKKENDIEFAVALRYSKHYRERSFMPAPSPHRRSDKFIFPAVGLCVEGIRVDFTAPGLAGTNIFCIANCVGPDAPRTNVSRSALDNESSRTRVNRAIFNDFLKIAKEEIDRLQTDENFSLSYATNQFPYIAGSIYQRQANTNQLTELYQDFPMFILEDQAGRRAVSLQSLISLGEFWTVESNAIDSLMDLLRDVLSDVTAKQVADRCGFKGEPMPDGPMLTNTRLNWLASALIENTFEVAELRASILDRRLDARWQVKKEKPIWEDFSNLSGGDLAKVYEELRQQRQSRNPRGDMSGLYSSITVASASIPMAGLDKYTAANVTGTTRFFSGTAVASFLAALPSATESDRIKRLLYLEALGPVISARSRDSDSVYNEVEYTFREMQARFGDRYELDRISFLDAVKACSDRLLTFKPYSWRRGAENEDG